jgi:hypothetical protein
MQNDIPDKANVIALPPLIYAAAFVLGLLIQLVFPVHLLPDKLAQVIGVLFIPDFSARRCKLALARGSARSPMKAHTIQALRNSHWTNDVSS